MIFCCKKGKVELGWSGEPQWMQVWWKMQLCQLQDLKFQFPQTLLACFLRRGDTNNSHTSSVNVSKSDIMSDYMGKFLQFMQEDISTTPAKGQGTRFNVAY